MARVAEYLVSIFEDAIREGNYDIKDITKKALAKRKERNSLIKKENSCGIFQDYGKETYINPLEKEATLK